MPQTDLICRDKDQSAHLLHDLWGQVTWPPDASQPTELEKHLEKTSHCRAIWKTRCWVGAKFSKGQKLPAMVGCSSLTEEHNNDISSLHAHFNMSSDICGWNHIQQPYSRQGSKLALSKPEPVLNTVLLPDVSDRRFLCCRPSPRDFFSWGFSVLWKLATYSLGILLEPL